MKEKIIERLRNYLDRKPGQNKLANEIGISAAHLSNVMNAKFDLVSEEIWAKINAFINANEPTEWRIHATRNYRLIHSVCHDARDNQAFRMITGYAGCGKTTALKAFAAEYPNVTYVMLDSISGNKQILKAIADALNIEATSRMTAPEIMKEIAAVLNNTPNSLLILDECGSIGKNNMVMLKDLSNKIEGQAGLILSGVNYAYSDIQKFAEKQNPGYPEVLSRIGHCEKLEKPDLSDVREICKINGLSEDKVILKINKHCSCYRQLRDKCKIAVKILQKDGVKVEDLVSALFK